MTRKSESNFKLDPIATITSLAPFIVEAKKYFEGAQLNVVISNHSAQTVYLSRYMADDSKHSARAIPPKDFIYEGESSIGTFRVNQIMSSEADFEFKIVAEDVDGELRTVNLHIKYIWETIDTGHIAVSFNHETSSIHTFFERTTHWVSDLIKCDLGVTVFATGGTLQLSIVNHDLFPDEDSDTYVTENRGSEEFIAADEEDPFSKKIFKATTQ